MIRISSLTKLLAAMTVMGMAVIHQPAIARADGSEVPLYIKYRYEKQTGLKWYDASPERQQKFILEIKEKRRIESEVEARRQSVLDQEEAAKEQERQMKKARQEMVRAARERRQQEKDRLKEMRKEQLRMKKEEMSRRIQLRKARNR